MSMRLHHDIMLRNDGCTGEDLRTAPDVTTRRDSIFFSVLVFIYLYGVHDA